MFLLVSYVLIALVFSFLCSVAEAVLLSLTSAHIAVLEKEGRPSGALMRRLKNNINKPLAAILALNTIAHTIGAAGAGAQAAVVFGSAYVGIASAVLTLVILIFSEIIPKTLGAHYWRQLAPITAFSLKYMIIALYPLVKMSEVITSSFSEKTILSGFSREEFSAMADLSEQEGLIAEQESRILQNLLLLRETSAKDAMTPRTVIFSLPSTTTVEEFYHKHDKVPFSRIPIFQQEQEHIIGFVLRTDLLLAQARGNGDSLLENYRRELNAIPSNMSLSMAFKEFLRLQTHIMLVIDEYGGVEGILTLEDVLETLLGLEIVDEKDSAINMQKKARRLWRKRAEKMGISID